MFVKLNRKYFNGKKVKLYFQVSSESGLVQRAHTTQSTPVCLSCDYLQIVDRNYTYFTAQFSPGWESYDGNPHVLDCVVLYISRFSWMLLWCLGPAVPQARLVSLTRPQSEVLAANQRVSSLVTRLAWPRLTVLSLVLPAGHTVEVRLLLPPQLRLGEPYRYPLLLHTWVFTEWQAGSILTIQYSEVEPHDE